MCVSSEASRVKRERGGREVTRITDCLKCIIVVAYNENSISLTAPTLISRLHNETYKAELKAIVTVTLLIPLIIFSFQITCL